MRISMRTIIIGVIAIVILGIYPVIAERDSYPHSHLPMFSVKRTEISRIDTAQGVSESGNIIRLSPRLIADTDEVVMAKDAVVNAINQGRTTELCQNISARIIDKDSTVSRVRIVTETYNAVDWFYDNKEPIAVQIHSECIVQ